MAAVLLATGKGVRVFREDREAATELDGRAVGFVAAARDGSCLALVDQQEIWQRDGSGLWSQAGVAEVPLESLTSLEGAIFAGAMNEAAMYRLGDGGVMERLPGFEATPGRESWFAGGPPLAVRSLAALATEEPSWQESMSEEFQGRSMAVRVGYRRFRLTSMCTR